MTDPSAAKAKIQHWNGNDPAVSPKASGIPQKSHENGLSVSAVPPGGSPLRLIAPDSPPNRHNSNERSKTPKTTEMGLITRRSEVQILPPPLIGLVFRALLRMHDALTSSFASCRSLYRGFFSGPTQCLLRLPCAGWRDASGSHAAPLRRRLGLALNCIGQPYACPMQLPYSTFESGTAPSRSAPCLRETSHTASRSNMKAPRVSARRRRTVRPEPVPHGPPSPMSAPGGPYGRPMPGHEL